MNLTFKIYNNLDDEISNYWNELEGESSLSCFQNFNWFKIWYRIFRKDTPKYQIKIICIFENNLPIAIFPFEIEKKFYLNILSWAGGDKSDYFYPIIRNNFFFNKDSFNCIFNRIISQINKIDVIHFQRQINYFNNKENPFVFYLKGNYEDSKIHIINLPDKWNAYTKNFLKNNFFKQNLRKIKKLKENGILRFVNVNDKNSCFIYLDKLFAYKNLQLKKKRIKIFDDLDTNFYRNIFENYKQTNESHLSFLSLDNDILSIHFGLKQKNRFYYLIIANNNNSNYDIYSPGRLLISFLIRWSISKKINIFDFTLGNEKYKTDWSNSSHVIFNYCKLINFRAFYYYIFIKFFFFLRKFNKI
jgi:CelD/BcsL family acetyltransferase involved in cellulose biosynthesis